MALSGGGSAAFKATSVSSQVNFVTAKGAVTGSPALLTAVGSGDPNAGIEIQAAGTGLIDIGVGHFGTSRA